MCVFLLLLCQICFFQIVLTLVKKEELCGLDISNSGKKKVGCMRCANIEPLRHTCKTAWLGLLWQLPEFVPVCILTAHVMTLLYETNLQYFVRVNSCLFCFWAWFVSEILRLPNPYWFPETSTFNVSTWDSTVPLFSNRYDTRIWVILLLWIRWKY